MPQGKRELQAACSQVTNYKPQAACSQVVQGPASNLRDGLPKKIAVLLDFVQMRGRFEGPAQIFCHIGVKKKVVQVVQIRGRGVKVIWSIKGVYFLLNANHLKFKLFFACIHAHTHKVSILP